MMVGIYVLKSGAILLLMLIFYKVLLEHQPMHHFKRFYLIFSLLAAFIIPLITFTEYIQIPDSPVQISSAKSAATNTLDMGEPSTLVGLWIIYILVSLGMMFRFVKNCIPFINRITNNPKIRIRGAVRVMHQEELPPHVFLRYLFLNGAKYLRREIPDSILKHEEAHARQLHSLDILFVELLQVLFWFNPLINFFKKSIALNHEFLADASALISGIPKRDYQNLLLTYCQKNTSYNVLASTINYPFIKKRLYAMNTVSNSSAISFRSFLLIPFVTLLIFGFSNRNVQIVGHAEKSSLETGLDPISAQIEIQDTIPKASDRELVEYNRLAKKFNQQDDTKYIRIRKVDVDRLNVLYSRMSPAQRKVNEPYPDFPEPPIPPAPPKAPSPNHLKPPTPPQPPAAPAANPSDGPPAPPAPADPPSAPSPPEPPMPNAGEYDAQRHALKEEARKLKRQLEMNEKQANALAKKQKALESQQKQLIKEQKEKLKELKLQQEETYQQLQDAQRHHVKQSVRVSETPQSARENILKMTKLNAKFIHEGKEITSDEALELVGKNQSIQIKSKSVSGERPVVKLTTKK